jgi:hypothetical protein
LKWFFFPGKYKRTALQSFFIASNITNRNYLSSFSALSKDSISAKLR